MTMATFVKESISLRRLITLLEVQSFITTLGYGRLGRDGAGEITNSSTSCKLQEVV